MSDLLEIIKEACAITVQEYRNEGLETEDALGFIKKIFPEDFHSFIDEEIRKLINHKYTIVITFNSETPIDEISLNNYSARGALEDLDIFDAEVVGFDIREF